MIRIVGVRFRSAGKVYYFDPKDLQVRMGDHVIAETSKGPEYGIISTCMKMVDEELVQQPLRSLVRLATEEDEQRIDMLRVREKEALRVCREKVREHELEMKMVDAEYSFDGSKLLFYFTADDRVDFRELVKDLAYVFKTRIELRQIGVRDEAKMLGGLGPCGRPVCCKQFLDDFRPVTIKMAKEQNLALSPTKISGLCGRLMCCLQYEESCYEQMHKLMPKTGKEIETPDGVGIVVENNVITERTKVKLTAEDGTIDIREYPYEDLGPGAKERAMERAAQAAADALNEPAGEGFTPLAQTSLPRQNRDRRQPRRTEPAQVKESDKQPKGEPKAQNKPQQKADKPQPKTDKPQQNRGERKENQNRNANKPKTDRQSKPDVPVPKAETGETSAPVAAPASGAAAVPFSRKRRSNNRRRSFGPRTPGGSGGQKA